MTSPTPAHVRRRRHLPTARGFEYEWFTEHETDFHHLLELPPLVPFTKYDIRRRLTECETPYIAAGEFAQLWKPFWRERDVHNYVQVEVERVGRPMLVEFQRSPLTTWNLLRSNTHIFTTPPAGEWLVPSVSLATLEEIMAATPPSHLQFEGWPSLAESCGGNELAREKLLILAAASGHSILAEVRSPVTTRSVKPHGFTHEDDERWWNLRSSQILPALAAAKEQELRDFDLVRHHHPDFPFEHPPYRITQYRYQ